MLAGLGSTKYISGSGDASTKDFEVPNEVELSVVERASTMADLLPENKPFASDS